MQAIAENVFLKIIPLIQVQSLQPMQILVLITHETKGPRREKYTLHFLNWHKTEIKEHIKYYSNRELS